MKHFKHDIRLGRQTFQTLHTRIVSGQGPMAKNAFRKRFAFFLLSVIITAKDRCDLFDFQMLINHLIIYISLML